jgi:chorismate mutase
MFLLYRIIQMKRKEILVQLADIKSWELPIDPIFTVAGPCAAESRNQVLSIAKALTNSGISFFRAGAWKPRTQPGCFEGHGKVALDWLVEARERYQIEVGTEVGLPEHLEACLRRKIRIVWIGTRTTTSPFIVQAIADSMKGTDMCVLIKNPLCPELKLWIGAIERFYLAGIVKIIAVHRGFSTVLKNRYRYTPMWRLVEELRTSIPGIPIICDPSHISGDQALITQVSHEALRRNYDGLMIEVHENPLKALSDGCQQLTPDAFYIVINDLLKKRK